MVNEGWLVLGGIAVVTSRREADGAFHVAPAVIPPCHDEVDFLPLLRTHIDNNQVSRRIEGYSPWIAKTEGENFPPCVRVRCGFHEGVVIRDFVRLSFIRFGMHIQPEDCSMEGRGILGKAEGILPGRISVGHILVRSPIPKGKIQHAVGAELNVPPVVVHHGATIEKWLGVLEEDLLRSGVAGTATGG